MLEIGKLTIRSLFLLLKLYVKRMYLGFLKMSYFFSETGNSIIRMMRKQNNES